MLQQRFLVFLFVRHLSKLFDIYYLACVNHLLTYLLTYCLCHADDCSRELAV